MDMIVVKRKLWKPRQSNAVITLYVNIPRPIKYYYQDLKEVSLAIDPETGVMVLAPSEALLYKTVRTIEEADKNG